MTNLAFEAGPDESVAPACIVVRRKTDGSYNFRLTEGGDDEIIRLLTALEVLVDRAGGITEAIEEQSVLVEQEDDDLEQLIADKLNRTKRELNKAERIARRQLERQLARRRTRRLGRIEDAERAEAGLPVIERDNNGIPLPVVEEPIVEEEG